MIQDVSIKHELTYCIQQYYPNQWELYFHHCRFVDDELIMKIAKFVLNSKKLYVGQVFCCVFNPPQATIKFFFFIILF